jgi:two-component system chemotaxis response regulator CheY
MKKKKVLIVDDSATVRQQVSMALKQVGFDVVEACDGVAGYEAIDRDSQIAVVVCDVNMPRMNGIEMLKKVKGSPKNAGLPIIMLTTEAASDLRLQAKEAGAKGWMVKPFDATQLVGVIQKLAA